MVVQHETEAAKQTFFCGVTSNIGKRVDIFDLVKVHADVG
jgi:hypothetical protein